MKTKWRNLSAFSKSVCGPSKRMDRLCSYDGGGEYKPCLSRRAVEHCLHERGNWDYVLISVFGALGWQGPSALIKVDLAPVHRRDLRTSLTGDNQHTKVGLPDFGKM